MRSDYLNNNSSLSGGFHKKIKKLVGDYSVQEADSGVIFLVNPAATTELDLPTVSDLDPGWNCEVWVTEDTDGSDGGMGGIVNIDFNSGADIVGHMYTTADAAGDSAVNNDDFINFTAAASPGDNVQIWTDGSRWYVRAFVKAAGSDALFHTAAAS
tara:strand:- start:242 stop:709 length:468 start_codon:yes stop_codon:yes gene_type:complete